MDYFHTISALHHKLLDYFTNIIGINTQAMRKKVFLLFIFTTTSFFAQYTLNTYANFEQTSIAQGYDSDPTDYNVLTGNINSIISLQVNSKSISDLTGIQDFVALRDLSCQNNQIINRFRTLSHVQATILRSDMISKDLNRTRIQIRRIYNSLCANRNYTNGKQLYGSLQRKNEGKLIFFKC